MLTSAFGTKLGNTGAISAVVAFKPLAHGNALRERRRRNYSFVVRERHSAVYALHLLATGAAEHHCRVAPSVEQQHHLLLGFEPLRHLLDQATREDLFFSRLLELLPHVDDLDFRQGPLLHALAEFDQPIFAFACVAIGFKRGRCRRENDRRVRELSSHNRYIASVIAGRLFLFVGAVMLFFYDIQRPPASTLLPYTTRSDHDARISAMNPMPLLGTLVIGKTRVQNGNLLSEDPVQIGGSSRR